MVLFGEFQQPDSRIICEQRNTRAILDKKNLGLGTVYVSERTFCWKEPGGVGFTLGYPYISMHAKATDPSVYDKECIYVMIDGKVSLPGEVEPVPSEEGSDNDNSEADISELILAPEDVTTLDAIYEALSQCQALNPDPEDMDDEDNLFEDAEEDIMDVAQQEVQDIGGGGDAVNSLAQRLEHQSVHINYSNGNQDLEDDHFEDAD